MARVRVVIASSVHRWNDTRIFVKQAQTLAAAGYDVVLAANCDEAGPFVRSGVRVVPLTRRSRAMRWLTWLSILRVILHERPTIVHVHDPELIPLLLVLKVGRRRVIADVHENVAEQVLHKEWIPRVFRRPLWLVLRTTMRWLPRLADAVVLAEDSYIVDFAPRENVTIIRNFPILSPRFKQHYETSVLRLIYVGDVRRVRGIGEYIAIVRELTARGVAVELRVIGSFADAEEENAVKAQVRELGLGDRVVWLGRRPPEEVNDRLVECDVGLALLHPIGNYRESYPTKMFEYMGAGLPVVASRFDLWERVLAGSDCGRVVDPLDVGEAASAVLDYARSQPLRERHGRNGRSAVVSLYNWDLEGSRLVNMYSAVSHS